MEKITRRSVPENFSLIVKDYIAVGFVGALAVLYTVYDLPRHVLSTLHCRRSRLEERAERQ